MSEQTALDDVEVEVEEVPEDEIVVLAQKWKKKRGSLIMALHELQGRLGYVPRESAMKLGREMGIPLANIYEVLTFYNYFKLESPGKYIISVCTGTACHIKGSPKLLHGVEDELGIKEGESTPDGRIYLKREEECIAACACAPAMTVDGHYHEHLTIAKVDEILDGLK